MGDEQGIPLSEVISELRRELLEARHDGDDHQIRFRVEEASVELEVAVTKEFAGGGGVKFWVYNAEAKGSLGSERTQRICLKLKPVDAKTGESSLISGKGELPPEMQ